MSCLVTTVRSLETLIGCMVVAALQQEITTQTTLVMRACTEALTLFEGESLIDQGQVFRVSDRTLSSLMRMRAWLLMVTVTTAQDLLPAMTEERVSRTQDQEDSV